jgi:hypothetical protein
LPHQGEIARTGRKLLKRSASGSIPISISSTARPDPSLGKRLRPTPSAATTPRRTPMQIPPEYASLSPAAVARLLQCSPTAVRMARRRAAGHCERCDTPAAPGSIYCARHALQITEARRTRTGTHPWQPGRRGRPPLSH